MLAHWKGNLEGRGLLDKEPAEILAMLTDREASDQLIDLVRYDAYAIADWLNALLDEIEKQSPDAE